MKTRIALCALAFALAAPLSAQTSPPLLGARIRVIQRIANDSSVVEGRLLRLRPDTVTIELMGALGRVRSIALDGSSRVEVAGRGHRHVGRSVLWGAGIGAVLVGALAAASYEPCTSDEFMGCMLAPTSPAAAAGYGALLGMPSGAVVGLAVGLLTRDVEWRPVRTEGVRVGLAPRPGRRLGLGVTLSL